MDVQSAKNSTRELGAVVYGTSIRFEHAGEICMKLDNLTANRVNEASVVGLRDGLVTWHSHFVKVILVKGRFVEDD